MRSVNEFRQLPLPAVGAPLTPEQAMHLAMSEAYKGAAHVSPNPLVGAIVVDQNHAFVSAGHHEIYGGPHAEVNALKDVPAAKLQQATVYVTLEPCAHEGKTPSCAKMMAKLPLKKVVYGLMDPNPVVAGQGAKILENAGIATEDFSQTHPELLADLEEVCEAFLWNFRLGKVFVSAKVAQSLDGQTGLRTGESQWITNEKSRLYAHHLRASHDAVLVGRGTMQIDNPSLNVRHPEITKTNKIVVIDPTAKLMHEASQLRVLRIHDAKNIFWCVGESHVAAADESLAQILPVREDKEGQLDLEHLLSSLWDAGIRSLMVEGGGTTISKFIEAALVNRLYVFQAPILIGSKGGRSWTESLVISQMKHRWTLMSPRFLSFDDDFMTTGRLV